MSSLVNISEEKEKHVSSYSIAKRWKLSLRTILNNVDRINKATVFLVKSCTEHTRIVCSDFKTLTIVAQALFAWSTLTHRWYHTFYPKRIRHIFNPHNLATKPP